MYIYIIYIACTYRIYRRRKRRRRKRRRKRWRRFFSFTGSLAHSRPPSPTRISCTYNHIYQEYICTYISLIVPPLPPFSFFIRILNIINIYFPLAAQNTMRDLLGKVIGEPVKTLIETVTGGGAGRLHVPLAGADVMEAELVGDLGDRHGLREILLVGEDEEDGVAELVLGEHLVELVVCLGDTLTIVGVDDEDEALSVLEVVPPEGTDLVLTSDIPHGEVDVLVLDGLHVEADCGDCCDDLTELQLVQDCGLTGGVETDHEDPHVLLAEQTAENLCKGRTHSLHNTRMLYSLYMYNAENKKNKKTTKQ